MLKKENRGELTMAAGQCRLQEWAAWIRDCQGRPSGMSVVSRCASRKNISCQGAAQRGHSEVSVLLSYTAVQSVKE